MNRTAINMPNSSPAIRVNRLMIAQALNIERRINSRDVQTQTLYISNVTLKRLPDQNP